MCRFWEVHFLFSLLRELIKHISKNKLFPPRYWNSPTPLSFLGTTESGFWHKFPILKYTKFSRIIPDKELRIRRSICFCYNYGIIRNQQRFRYIKITAPFSVGEGSLAFVRASSSWLVFRTFQIMAILFHGCSASEDVLQPLSYLLLVLCILTKWHLKTWKRLKIGNCDLPDEQDSKRPCNNKNL